MFLSTHTHICNNFWTVSLVSTLFLMTNAQYPHFSTGSAIYPQFCLLQDQTDIHTVPLITPNPYCSKASAQYADCSTYQWHCSAYQTNIHTVPQDQPHLQSFFTESALKSTLFHRISPIYTVPRDHCNVHTVPLPAQYMYTLFIRTTLISTHRTHQYSHCSTAQNAISTVFQDESKSLHCSTGPDS